MDAQINKQIEDDWAENLDPHHLKFLMRLGFETLMNVRGISVCRWQSHKGAMWYIKNDDYRFVSLVLRQLNGDTDASNMLEKFFLHPYIREIVDRTDLLSKALFGKQRPTGQKEKGK